MLDKGFRVVRFSSRGNNLTQPHTFQLTEAIATRLADAATNSGNSTLINSTEGTLYFEGSALTNQADII